MRDVSWKVNALREALAELVVQVVQTPGHPTALDEAIARAGRVLRLTEQAQGAPSFAARENF
jgi:hypothetical protein